MSVPRWYGRKPLITAEQYATLMAWHKTPRKGRRPFLWQMAEEWGVPEKRLWENATRGIKRYEVARAQP